MYGSLGEMPGTLLPTRGCSVTELSLCSWGTQHRHAGHREEKRLWGPWRVSGVGGAMGTEGRGACSLWGVPLSPIHVKRRHWHPEAGRPREPGCRSDVRQQRVWPGVRGQGRAGAAREPSAAELATFAGEGLSCQRLHRGEGEVRVRACSKRRRSSFLRSRCPSLFSIAA